MAEIAEEDLNQWSVWKNLRGKIEYLGLWKL